jgi:hypothetical protein
VSVILLGGDPLVHGSTALPVFEKHPAGDFRYSFNRAARARGHSTVIAKLSDDMLTWPNARDTVIDTSSSGLVTITAEIDHDAITIEIPARVPRSFIRLEVTQPLRIGFLQSQRSRNPSALPPSPWVITGID